MNTSLAHLPLSKRQKLQAVINVIVKAVQPEKVILFGMHSAKVSGLPLSGDNPLTGILGGYDLLVVTRRGDHRYDHELQDIIENRCRVHAPVTVLVHDIDHVNNQLLQGQYFFFLTQQEGILLYDAGNIPLAAGVAPDLAQIRAVAQEDFERWRHRGKAFYRSAVFNLHQKEYRLAAFMLHQAAEHIYQGVLLAFTGYKPCTHNLDKLRRYTNRFSLELALLFPRDNEDEEALFKLLQHGYVDARYKEDYMITGEEVKTLARRIENLLSIAERVCRNRFLSLEKMAMGA
jgi:HEPN domain-containing protein